MYALCCFMIVSCCFVFALCIITNPSLHKVKRGGELLTPRGDWTTVLGDECVGVGNAKLGVYKPSVRCTSGGWFVHWPIVQTVREMYI